MQTLCPLEPPGVCCLLNINCVHRALVYESGSNRERECTQLFEEVKTHSLEQGSGMMRICWCDLRGSWRAGTADTERPLYPGWDGEPQEEPVLPQAVLQWEGALLPRSLQEVSSLGCWGNLFSRMCLSGGTLLQNLPKEHAGEAASLWLLAVSQLHRT